MLRLWAVVFVFNVLGIIAFAFVFVHGGILSPTATELLLGEVATKIDAGFQEVTLKAVFGGWLVALIAWKLDEKARKLLVEDLQQRPWATHSQRAEFLFALLGVRVSEATICRAVGRLSHSRKKDPEGQQNETSS